jgi:hypothetical protein
MRERLELHRSASCPSSASRQEEPAEPGCFTCRGGRQAFGSPSPAQVSAAFGRLSHHLEAYSSVSSYGGQDERVNVIGSYLALCAAIALCSLHFLVRERQWWYFANHWALTAFLPTKRIPGFDLPVGRDLGRMIKDFVPPSSTVTGGGGLGALQPPILRVARFVLLALAFVLYLLAGLSIWGAIGGICVAWAGTQLFFRIFGWHWLYRACRNSPSSDYWNAVRKSGEGFHP